MKSLFQALPLPKPQHTQEFPRGLITDYIRAVDEMRRAAAEAAKQNS